MTRSRSNLPAEVVKYLPRHHRLLPPAPLFHPLEEVALQFRTMPFGDLIRFCKLTGADPEFLWEWANGRL